MTFLSKFKSERGAAEGAVLGGGIFAVVLLAVSFFTMDAVWNSFKSYGHAGLPWIITGLVIGILTFGAFVTADSEGSVLLGGILLVVVWMGLAVFQGYYDDVTHRTDNITFTDEALPDVQPRVPLQNVRRILPQAAGSFPRAVVSDSMYMPDNAGWGAVADGKNGMFNPVRLGGVITSNGRSTDTCEFPAEVKALEGGVTNNLMRDLYSLSTRGIHRQMDAASAWCTDDGPMVVVPHTRITGSFWTAEVPAGVATIDHTGALTYDASAIEPGDYPVPIVPIVAAEEAIDAVEWYSRTSVNSGDREVYDPEDFELVGPAATILDARKLGLERLDSSAVNSGNPGEYLLWTVPTDDAPSRPVYMTPLTPYGDNEKVVAVAVVYADTYVPGDSPDVTVHLLPQDTQRASNELVVNALQSSYQLGRGPVDFSRFSVVEMVPATDGQWRASIGNATEVVYYALIDPISEDEIAPSRLYDSRSNREVARSAGQEAAPASDDAAGDIPLDTPIGELSNGELADLIEAAQDELIDRLDAAASASAPAETAPE